MVLSPQGAGTGPPQGIFGATEVNGACHAETEVFVPAEVPMHEALRSNALPSVGPCLLDILSGYLHFMVAGGRWSGVVLLLRPRPFGGHLVTSISI